MGNHLLLQRGCLNFGKFCSKKSMRNRLEEGLFHRLPPAWAKAPLCQSLTGKPCGFSLSFRGFHSDSFLSFHPYQLPFPPEKAIVMAVTWAPWSEMQVATSLCGKRPGQSWVYNQAGGKGPLGPTSCKALLMAGPLLAFLFLYLNTFCWGEGRGDKAQATTRPERPHLLYTGSKQSDRDVVKGDSSPQFPFLNY